MIRIIFTVLFMALMLSAFSQPIEERLIEPFTKIHIAGDVDIDLVRGDKVLVKIREVEGAEFEDVEATVEDGELKIISRLDLFHDIKIRATVVYTVLERVSVSSDASIYSDTALDTRNIKFIAKNGGIIDVTVDADTIHSSVFTGGLVALKGKTKYQQATVSSGGTLSAFKMECDTAEINSNTGSTAKVYVTRYIDAKAGTGGFINIMGDPVKEIVETNLGGKIVREEVSGER